ncbi:hypothetical protein Bbelb_098220, partial [Branchiostoma belcheri]
TSDGNSTRIPTRNRRLRPPGTDALGRPVVERVEPIEELTTGEIDALVTRLPGVRPTAAPGEAIGTTDVLRYITTAMIEAPRETTAAIKEIVGPEEPGVEATTAMLDRIEEATTAPGPVVGPTEAPSVMTTRVILTTDELGRPVTQRVAVVTDADGNPVTDESGRPVTQVVTPAPAVTPRPDLPTPEPGLTPSPDLAALLKRLDDLEKKLTSQAEDLQKELQEEVENRQKLEDKLTEQKGELGRLTEENIQLRGWSPTSRRRSHDSSSSRTR